jgi:hypothetical protein
VDARGPEELPAFGQGVADRVLQVRGLVSGQFVGSVFDRQYYRLAVAPYRNVTLIAREELDQERLHSVSCVDSTLARDYNSTGERKYGLCRRLDSSVRVRESEPAPPQRKSTRAFAPKGLAVTLPQSGVGAGEESVVGGRRPVLVARRIVTGGRRIVARGRGITVCRSRGLVARRLVAGRIPVV